jgi:uncharacterized protein (TIGR03083 family)
VVIEPAHGLAQLEQAVADVVEMLADAELDLPVPSCPGWTVADLVAHLGEAHLWAEHAVRVGDPDAPEPSPPRHDRIALRAWYAESAEVLLATLRATKPDTACWTFGRRPHTARFWFRRQAHEAAMHRWDLAAAVGRDVGYPSSLAADGVDEVATMFFPRQVRLQRIPPLPKSLAVRVEGLDRRVLAGDGTDPSVGRADAEVSGPAEVLVLLLWGRLALDDPRIQVTGDRAAAALVLSAGIVP